MSGLHSVIKIWLTKEMCLSGFRLEIPPAARILICGWICFGFRGLKTPFLLPIFMVGFPSAPPS